MSLGMGMGSKWGRGHVTHAPVPDSTPAAFTLTDEIHAEILTDYIASFTVSGINTVTAISITAPGTYSKNGGAYGSADGTVVNGDVVRVKLQSSGSFSTAVTTTLTVGGVSDTFSVTTKSTPDDVTPDAFTFTDQTDVAVSTVINSAWIQLAGTNVPVSISVTGGQFQIADNGSGLNATSPSSTATTIAPGKWFRARHTSSVNPSTATNTAVTIGGVSDTFTSTTADTVPDVFAFTDVTAAALSTVYTSNTITVGGLSVASPISIVGGTYSKNGGAYTSANGTVVNTDTVAVRVTSSGSNETAVNAILTIGGVSDTYTVTTLAAAGPGMFNQTLFELLLGPTMSLTDIIATGAIGAAFAPKLTTAFDNHWTEYRDGSYDGGVPSPFAGDWSRVDYYDRADKYYYLYAASDYTNSVYRDRARAIAAHYINNVTNGFTDYNVLHNDQQVVGVGLYYADTGDAAALTFIKYMGAMTLSDPWLKKIGSTSNGAGLYGYDGRVTARGILALVVAHLCNAPLVASPGWGSPTVPGMTYAEGARQALTQTIAGRNGNNIWRYPLVDPAYAGYMAKPWMIFMICDAMAYYERAFEADARIAPAIQAAAEYLFTGTSTALAACTSSSTFWNASAKGFYYIEGPAGGEGTPTDPPGVDLDGMSVNAYAYTYAKTSDTLWKDRAELILEGSLGTYDQLPAQKQINQFATGLKAFDYLY